MPLLTVQGRFFRAVRADCADEALALPQPASAGRYHRPGQPALYLSPSPAWAAIAVSPYLDADGLERIIMPVELDSAQVIDLRDEAASAKLGVPRGAFAGPWQPALERGEEPPSWHVADAARAAGADGLIDPSRRISDGWHLALFRWNDLGGPRLSICGEPVPMASPGAA